MSSSSGVSFPTSNLEVGMLCNRTDLGKIYKLTSISPDTWVSISDLSTLNDTTITAVDAGELLVWSATGGDTGTGGWVNRTLAEASVSKTDHTHTIDDLSNTTITANTSGEILKWDGSKWINNTLAEASISKTDHSHSVSGMSDTTITTITTNNVLQWNGTAWVNKSLANAGISASHSHPYVPTAGGNMTGNLGVTGSITATGDVTAYGTVSDKRMKKNVEIIEGALSKVNELSGYTFQYTGSTDRLTGVIAQEVQAVLPEAVYETDAILEGTNEHILAVRHGNMVGLLIEAVKELSLEVSLLKSKLGEK